MKLLIVLTYYRPHTSGLTIYAERLAKALVRRGHQVTVLTSHYEKDLPYEEIRDGVRIRRVPVLFRLSKGVIMPTFGPIANRLVMENDAIHLHLPQFDAAGVALRGRLLKKPTVITYHCDLHMPPGGLSWLANQGVNLMNNLAGKFTHRIITYTRDYGENSPYLRRFLHKIAIIRPPVEMPEVPEAETLAFRRIHNPKNHHPVIGMAARFATEKGVEVLLRALPGILEKYPHTCVFFAGPYQDIIGEEEYFKRLYPEIQRHEANGNWKFLGNLSPEKMVSFYKSIDALVLPSLNSTESFGLVQIEAMIHGKPVVASDLPGVRQPVTQHQMGKIIPVGDSGALCEALLEILENPASFTRDPELIRIQYLPDSVAVEYEKLFDTIRNEA